MDFQFTALDLPADGASLAIVSLYFLVMAVLTVHGAHRVRLIRTFLKVHKLPQPTPALPAEWPSVTVQLPIYNERFVVESLLEAVCRLDYPREKLEIQVLDDSTDETAAVASRAVARLAAAGHPIVYLHREARDGYKAGALQNGLNQSNGELIAMFDADFSPAPDFLRRLVPCFEDPGIGCVQARWEYRNREQSVLTRIQGILLDSHFVIEQTARSRASLFFNFNGTAGVLRRAMIEDAGGWQHDTLTEDTDLSYRAQLRGWKFVYLPEVAVESELPADIASFQVQQSRWAKGLVQTGLKLLPRILRAPLPWRVKQEALLHFSSNASYPFMALLALLMTPAAVVRSDGMPPWMLWLDIVIFFATFGSLAAYYLIPRIALTGRSGLRELPLLPAAMAGGIGLILSNTRGVIEAFAGRKTPFERTAKLSADAEKATLARALYGVRSGWIAWANLAAAGWLSGCAAELASAEIWAPVPFITLFALGFGYAGIAGAQEPSPSGGGPATDALRPRPARSSAS